MGRAWRRRLCGAALGAALLPAAAAPAGEPDEDVPEPPAAYRWMTEASAVVRVVEGNVAAVSKEAGGGPTFLSQTVDVVRRELWFDSTFPLMWDEAHPPCVLRMGDDRRAACGLDEKGRLRIAVLCGDDKVHTSSARLWAASVPSPRFTPRELAWAACAFDQGVLPSALDAGSTATPAERAAAAELVLRVGAHSAGAEWHLSTRTPADVLRASLGSSRTGPRACAFFDARGISFAEATGASPRGRDAILAALLGSDSRAAQFAAADAGSLPERDDPELRASLARYLQYQNPWPLRAWSAAGGALDEAVLATLVPNGPSDLIPARYRIAWLMELLRRGEAPSDKKWGATRSDLFGRLEDAATTLPPAHRAEALSALRAPEGAAALAPDLRLRLVAVRARLGDADALAELAATRWGDVPSADYTLPARFAATLGDVPGEGVLRVLVRLLVEDPAYEGREGIERWGDARRELVTAVLERPERDRALARLLLNEEHKKRPRPLDDLLHVRWALGDPPTAEGLSDWLVAYVTFDRWAAFLPRGAWGADEKALRALLTERRQALALQALDGRVDPSLAVDAMARLRAVRNVPRARDPELAAIARDLRTVAAVAAPGALAFLRSLAAGPSLYDRPEVWDAIGGLSTGEEAFALLAREMLEPVRSRDVSGSTSKHMSEMRARALLTALVARAVRR